MKPARLFVFQLKPPAVAVVAVILAGLAPAVPSASAQAPPQTSRELILTVGKSLLVNSAAPIERVAVGFGDIAEARVVAPTELLVDGKAPGETSLIIWQQGGSKLFFDVMVRPNTTVQRTRLETLQRELQQNLSGQDIHATYENDAVVLTGTAKDLPSAERAATMASILGKVVNLLYIAVPQSDAQILLKVRFAEVTRSASEQLGFSLVSTGAANTVGSINAGQAGVSISPGSNGGASALSLGSALNIFLFRPDLNLAAAIQALESRNLFQTLDEPNVLAVNGKQASFLAGGEFPYPTIQGGGFGLGQVTVAFREFGVRLNFLPLLTPRGTIRLAVAPEVSSLDYANGLTVSGFTVPGLTTRRVQTEIELEPGQSFAIAGLLDRSLTETLSRIPLLSSIPLLGKIFQNKNLTKNNDELLVIVTPELVRPIPKDRPVPQLSMPRPLPGPAEMPRTPGLEATGPVLVTPPVPAIPMEQLVQSIQDQNRIRLMGPNIQGLINNPEPTQLPATAQPTAPTTPTTPAPAPGKQQ